MGYVSIETEEHVKLSQSVLSEAYDHGRYLSISGSFGEWALCIELSEHVEMRLRKELDHGNVGLEFKPGRTAIRDLNERLPGTGFTVAYFRCANEVCPKNLEALTNFKVTVYRLSGSTPTIDYWINLEKARVAELRQVLDVIAGNINWWHQRMTQGHPEYQSEIDDLNHQCDRALEVIAELDELGVDVDPVWFEVCDE